MTVLHMYNRICDITRCAIKGPHCTPLIQMLWIVFKQIIHQFFSTYFLQALQVTKLLSLA